MLNNYCFHKIDLNIVTLTTLAISISSERIWSVLIVLRAAIDSCNKNKTN